MKNVLGTILLTMALVACSSKPIKDAPVVVDKSTSAPVSTQTTDSGASTSGATTSDLSANPLKDPNNILSQRSVYFDYDQDAIKAEYRPLIDAHAKYLLSHTDARVTLQGNTDASGSSEYNLSLGQRRAVAVKRQLNLLGVQDKQIETVSYGKEKANAGCVGDQVCGKQDRRVDIVYQGE